MNRKKIFGLARLGVALIAAVILLGSTGWAFLDLMGTPAEITQGAELEDNIHLTLSLNNYRASGAGGYPFYSSCPLVQDQGKDISELIMDYVARHKNIEVDQHQWLKLITE